MIIKIALCSGLVIQKLGSLYRIVIKQDFFGLTLIAVYIAPNRKLYKVYAEADGSVKYYQDIESIKPAFFETLRAAKSYALDLAKYVESDYQTIKPNQSDFQYCILDERKKRSQSRMHSGITNPKDYLVVTDCNKKEAYHLPVYIDGIPNRKLMGNAWAALHSNFRGQSYKGPQRQEAILALKKLYQSLNIPTPEQRKKL